jgi:hypothetical protein
VLSLHQHQSNTQSCLFIRQGRLNSAAAMLAAQSDYERQLTPNCMLRPAVMLQLLP